LCPSWLQLQSPVPQHPGKATADRGRLPPDRVLHGLPATFSTPRLFHHADDQVPAKVGEVLVEGIHAADGAVAGAARRRSISTSHRRGQAKRAWAERSGLITPEPANKALSLDASIAFQIHQKGWTLG
jgi:hypothetical protein